VLDGSISGNAGTATSLQQQTTFSMTGDIAAPSFQFNGISGGLSKVFNTSISPTFITSKQDIATLSAPQKSYSLKDDYVLVYRPSVSGLLRATRETFVGDLGLPVGAIIPYAGPNVPFGFLLCDGAEILISQYIDLYQVVGTTYNGNTALLASNTFRLPDLRGRFPLGKDNMDNGIQVAVGDNNVDSGGGNVDRVSGVEPDTLGGEGGNSQYALGVSNLPNHEHNMQGSTGQQYYASRLDTAVPLDSGAFLNSGGTTTNRVQYLPSSGGIKTGGVTGQPYPVINPFLTINYIIRTGTPSF
jgi:microcystin-dependent protein